MKRKNEQARQSFICVNFKGGQTLSHILSQLAATDCNWNRLNSKQAKDPTPVTQPQKVLRESNAFNQQTMARS